MSYCHSSTGYHVVARQQWHFLLLRAVSVIERGRGREVSHVSLVSVMAGSAYSNITPRCAHTNTRAQPKNPLVCDERLRLSACPAATLFHPSRSLALSSVLLCLSHTSSLHFHLSCRFPLSCSSKMVTSPIPRYPVPSSLPWTPFQ